MAYEYIIKSGCSTTSYDHYHSANISDINSALNSNLPNSAYISSAKVYLDMNHDTVLGTIGNADLDIWFCNNGDSNSGTNLYSGKTNKDPQVITVDISGYLSSRYSPFALSTPYPKIAVYYDSDTRRAYHCDMFKVMFEWYIATQRVVLTHTEGGNAYFMKDGYASIDSTFDRNSSLTIYAVEYTGYRFVKWSDGNTSATRTITVSGDINLQAIFEKKSYDVVVDYGNIGINGEKCTIRGAGTYKYGDTVTLEAVDIPLYHTFDGWALIASGSRNTKDNPYTFTIDEAFLAGTNAETSGVLYFNCHIKFTGYTLKANTSPEGAGDIYYGYFITYEGNTNWDRHFPVPEEGILLNEGFFETVGLEVFPEEAYDFVSWSDGDTQNPRPLQMSGDATYTAVFKKKQFYIYFYNYDGKFLKWYLVDYGDIPVYKESTPTRPETAECTYEFDGWDRELRPATSGTSYTAKFKEIKKQYELKVDCYPSVGGTVTGAGTYDYGTYVTVTVIPKDDYEFVCWADDNSLTNPSRDILVTENSPNTVYTAILRINKILVNKVKTTGILVNTTRSDRAYKNLEVIYGQ